ncbi:hypothetical protein D3C78_1188520 [compost metagenome]
MLDGADAAFEKIAPRQARGLHHGQALSLQILHFQAQEVGRGIQAPPAPQGVDQDQGDQGGCGCELQARRQRRQDGGQQGQGEQGGAGHQRRGRAQHGQRDQGQQHRYGIEQPVGPGRSGLQMAVLQRVVEHMGLHGHVGQAPQAGARRGGKALDQARGGRTDQHVFAAKCRGRDGAAQHVDVGVAGER